MSVPTGSVAGSDADIQAAFAATLVDEWVRGEVTHAVVCPGSRSTPLAVALAAHPGITVHVRLDERSAGFTAVGMGLATGRPAVVVTTSGTAAAELHPAMVEADLAGVPLIACTADRPPELRDVGAPQTIDQTHLFGRSVRWFADPGVPAAASRSSWRSLAARAVIESGAGGRGPGPVHLNLPFREPLLGNPDQGGGVVPGRVDGRPWHQEVALPAAPPAGWIRSAIDDGTLSPDRRGLIVSGAGGGDRDAVLALSATLGWPVLADPRSGLRGPEPEIIATADGLLRSEAFARSHIPEVVLRIGERWVSKVVNAALSAAVAGGATEIVVEPAWRWIDPEHQTATFVRADPALFCTELVGHLVDRGDRMADRGWLRSWQAAEASTRQVIALTLGESSPAAPESYLDEPSLAHRLFARLPPEATLVVSSSMPVRDLEAFALPRDRPPRVVANRGANGIDGVVSTALGVALASGAPTVVLVGDLAFLHDVSALVGSVENQADLTVVVADNGGGGIFSFLPPAGALDPASFEELFGTPQPHDPAAVAAGFGWPVDELGPSSSVSALEDLLDHRVGSGGASVIRVRLPDREENVAVHRRINGAIVEAVERVVHRAVDPDRPSEDVEDVDQQGRGS
jgi:2-succinyl-5-enolpyruvyl-6-hydroxy-3-cyclohexene-1-carboxylate synthase